MSYLPPPLFSPALTLTVSEHARRDAEQRRNGPSLQHRPENGAAPLSGASSIGLGCAVHLPNRSRSHGRSHRRSGQ